MGSVTRGQGGKGVAVVLLAALALIAGSLGSPAPAAGEEARAVTCMGRTATRVGTAGPDILTGTPGPDVIVGLGGNDVIDGLGGKDRICGNGGNDIIRGGAGNDRVRGGLGWDIILGGDGADVLRGGGGADVVHGEGGDDRLLGQAGADELDGGPGIDTISGGLGIDWCYGEAKTACELPPPPLPWIISIGRVGPIVVGAPIGTLNALTGRTWTWEEPGAEGCLAGHTPGLDIFLQADDGVVIDHITIYDPAAATTALGLNVGDTRAALNTAHGAHVEKVTDDGYGGVAVWIDLGRDGLADIIAVLNGAGLLATITSIRVPAVLTEGGCL